MFRDTFVTASWKLIERITRPASQQNCVKDAMHVINVRLISITEKQYFELTVWSSIGKWKSARKLLRPDPFLIHPHERVGFHQMPNLLLSLQFCTQCYFGELCVVFVIDGINREGTSVPDVFFRIVRFIQDLHVTQELNSLL